MTPVVRSFIAIPAGVFRMPLGRYTLLTIPGSVLWAFAFAGAGWAAGSQWEDFHHSFRYAEYVVAGAILVLIAAGIWRHRRGGGPSPGDAAQSGRARSKQGKDAGRARINEIRARLRTQPCAVSAAVPGCGGHCRVRG